MKQRRRWRTRAAVGSGQEEGEVGGAWRRGAKDEGESGEIRKRARALPGDECVRRCGREENREMGILKSSAILILLNIYSSSKVLNFLMKLEDGLPDVVGIQLVFVGGFCDHHVVGVESMLHHPPTLENLLLHSFEPRLHASGPLRSLSITDVQQPIMHLNGLRVSLHLR